jgi:hypothetical protein
MLIVLGLGCPSYTAIQALRKPGYSSLGMVLLLCVFMQLIAPGVVVFLIQNGVIHIEPSGGAGWYGGGGEYLDAGAYVGLAFLMASLISWVVMVGLLIAMRSSKKKPDSNP